jgi:hypothetical protein
MIAVIAVLCIWRAEAQSGTSSVSGTVFDQSGTVIAGASVRLGNADKGFARSVTTKDNGSFTFQAIQPGIYCIEVEMKGFKKFINNDVRKFVDSPTDIDAVLEIGSINETVTVTQSTADALINTQDATVGNPFNSNQVTQLPVEARDVSNLLTLQPGVTRFGYVAGGRSDQANITLDGVDINDAQTNSLSTPALRLNAEAIQEFRVTTANPNASQGRSSGAQISLVTKSGTNQLRGALFLTGRRTGWTANDFFNNRSGVERPKFDRNVFGGAIGGPIWKERVFFFYSYEGERTTQGKTIVRRVPLPTLGQGIIRFRKIGGGIGSLDCSQIATVFPYTTGCNHDALVVFAGAASRYPANSFEIGDSTATTLLNTAGFRFNANNKIKNNSHVLRLDFNLSMTQQAFFRFNYSNDVGTFPPQFPDTPVRIVPKHPLGFVIGHNWMISNNLFNVFRYGLTRDAFTNQGDSTDNAIVFNGVFAPRLYQRTFSRVTPVQNIVEDVSWIRRNHTFQFGTNIRLIANKQQNYAGAYDSAATVPAYYPYGSVIGPINTYLFATFQYRINPNDPGVLNAIPAVIGRYSSYDANLTFLHDGSLQPAGTPTQREFRTQEYDLYVQDIWKLRPDLTITAGLRYGLSRPVYEAGGYEVKPTLSLSEFFDKRAVGAANGTPYNVPLVLDLSGPANGRSALYKWDKNNFQPRIAVAWSPNFRKSHLGWLFGQQNESVIRGSFGITNDYFGQQLAVSFDQNNTLGFSSSSQIPANYYNLTDNVGPLFTGFDQNIRNLPFPVPLPGNISFPHQAPISTSPRGAAIEGGFDENLVAPINYSWSLTYERTLPRGLIVSVSYLGRKARNLLLPRDAAAIANFVDTQSGTDWNTAATQLEIFRQHGTAISQIQQIAYFANLFPSNLADMLGCPVRYNQTQAVYSLVFGGDEPCAQGTDWTTAQLSLSQLSSRFPGEHIFYQPQYGVYSAWSSIGRSNYHGLTFTIRQRLGRRLTMDFNYTFSNSMDDGSSLQAAGVFAPGFIINPFRQRDMYSASDFDMRHIANANAIIRLPFGRGEPIFSNVSKLTDLFLGGWQLTGIFRFNSGLPISAPLEDRRWTTNWTWESYATRTANIETCPTRGGALFGCNSAEAYSSFRNAYPGETGERNVFRLPGYWVLDMGLGKSFDMPWEGHSFQVRWEIFNVTNTQHMGAVANYVIQPDPQNATHAPTNWSNFTSIQGTPRSMQFVLRYSF